MWPWLNSLVQTDWQTEGWEGNDSRQMVGTADLGERLVSSRLSNWDSVAFIKSYSKSDNKLLGQGLVKTSRRANYFVFKTNVSYPLTEQKLEVIEQFIGFLIKQIRSMFGQFILSQLLLEQAGGA